MSMEYRVILTGVIFMFLLNLTLLAVTGDTGVEYNPTEVINEITNNMGIISGVLTSIILNIAVFVYGVFGVDFVVSLAILPMWFNSFLLLYNTIIIVSLLFYVIERLWFG